MRKKIAYVIFDGRVEMAKALGLTPQALTQWPETLSIRQQDQVIGAGLRTGKIDVRDLPTLLRSTTTTK